MDPWRLSTGNTNHLVPKHQVPETYLGQDDSQIIKIIWRNHIVYAANYTKGAFLLLLYLSLNTIIGLSTNNKMQIHLNPKYVFCWQVLFIVYAARVTSPDGVLVSVVVHCFGLLSFLMWSLTADIVLIFSSWVYEMCGY